jgi:hypothetical protein
MKENRVLTIIFTLCILVIFSLTSCEPSPIYNTTNAPETVTTPAPLTYAKLFGPGIIDAGDPSSINVLVQYGFVGQAFYVQLPAFGGHPPYHWEIVSGNLPAGLTLDPGGKISGTLSKSGNYECTIVLSDSTGSEVTQNVRMTAASTAAIPGEMGPKDVQPGPPPNPRAPTVVYTPPPPTSLKALVSVVIPPTYAAGQYFAVVPCVQGLGASWTFRFVGLPKELSYDASSGLVQGDVRLLAKPFNVSVFVHGDNGLDAQTTFTVNVSPPPSQTPAPTTNQHGGTTTAPAPVIQPTPNVNNQYIEVTVSQSAYGVADIWVDGHGPYRQQYKGPASVGTHTIRIKTYGGSIYPATDKTINGSVSAGNYWIYQLK